MPPTSSIRSPPGGGVGTSPKPTSEPSGATSTRESVSGSATQPLAISARTFVSVWYACEPAAVAIAFIRSATDAASASLYGLVVSSLTRATYVPTGPRRQLILSRAGADAGVGGPGRAGSVEYARGVP